MLILLAVTALAGTTRLVADTPAELTQKSLKAAGSVTVGVLSFRATDQSTEFRPGSTNTLSVVCASSCSLMDGKQVVATLATPQFNAETHAITWTATLDRQAVEVVWTPTATLFDAFRAR